MIGNRKIAALCISRLNDDVSHDMITSLAEKLKVLNCNLFVYGTTSDLYWNIPSETGEMSVFKLADMDMIDLLIIYSEKIKSTSAIEELESRARENGIPIISIGNTNGRYYDIEFDYEAGFEAVVRHVLEVHKPETLHFIAGIKDNEFSDNRLRVFKNVLEQENFPFDDSMVSYGEFWSVPAAAATEKLIEENRVPDAIICANDAMAISVCNVLKSHGFKVPDDVIVTGFDGIPEIEFSVPKITSSKCRNSDIAAKCAEYASLFWEGKQPTKLTRVPPQIILSESCGCDYSEKVNTSEYLSTMNNNFYRFRDEDHSLSEMTSRIQSCRTIEDAARQMIRSTLIYDLTCFLTLECIDESVNPLKPPKNYTFGDKMCLFFNADSPEDPPREFLRKNIMPGLDVQLELGYPIIFMALNFLDIPLGYVCFHYHDNNISNYIKMPQTVNALNNAIGGFRNIRYQQYIGKQLEDMYKVDPLTGLYNRRGFMHEYNKLLSWLPENRSLTVVLSDLDGLKQINDHYGHEEGDRAIRTAAEALRYACPDNAICMRFGGDEMLAVILGKADEDIIRRNADEYLNDYNIRSEKPYNVSASLGIYVTEIGESLDFEELIKKSDVLMYADKKLKKSNDKSE